jgi:choline-sulfatase
MSTSENRPPNLVLIMSDQHNPRVAGYAGDPVVKTPHLDRLARNGTAFRNVYCPYPLCVPSRMAFMTGQYPGDVNVWDNGSILSSDVPTFAHALGGAGYEAVLCGRMHFYGPDQFHGFERRLYGESDDLFTPEILGRGHNRTNGQTKYAVEVAGYGRTGAQAYDRNVTAEACSFIAGRAHSERPYCLVVGYFLPHNPLICSRDLFEHYLAALPLPRAMPDEYLSNLHPALRLWRERRGVDDLTPEQNHRGLAAYYGLVTELDRNIGRIVDAVSRSSGAEDTVVIYTADHGDNACERGMWWKSSYFDGAARVPLIVSDPKRFDRDRNVDRVASLIDLGPTVLDIAGAEPLPHVTGYSLTGFLNAGGEPDDWPDKIFCEYIGDHGDKPSCMIRSGPWKLMYYSEFDSFLLFNMEEDPNELNDLAADPSCRNVAQSLLGEIHARWSAKRMIDAYDRELRTRRVIDSCGHGAMPHDVERLPDLTDANEFDFAQVPNWEQIRRRVEE